MSVIVRQNFQYPVFQEESVKGRGLSRFLWNLPNWVIGCHWKSKNILTCSPLEEKKNLQVVPNMKDSHYLSCSSISPLNSHACQSQRPTFMSVKNRFFRAPPLETFGGIHLETSRCLETSRPCPHCTQIQFGKQIRSWSFLSCTVIFKWSNRICCIRTSAAITYRNWLLW